MLAFCFFANSLLAVHSALHAKAHTHGSNDNSCLASMLGKDQIPISEIEPLQVVPPVLPETGFTAYAPLIFPRLDCHSPAGRGPPAAV